MLGLKEITLPDGVTRPYSVWLSGNYPSTVAYLAQLMIHRYAMLGILDETGLPLQQMGILETPAGSTAGKLCGECGNHTTIRKDGGDFCTACGAVGTCG